MRTHSDIGLMIARPRQQQQQLQSVQQTCCNLRVSGCVYSAIHALHDALLTFGNWKRSCHSASTLTSDRSLISKFVFVLVTKSHNKNPQKVGISKLYGYCLETHLERHYAYRV